MPRARFEMRNVAARDGRGHPERAARQGLLEKFMALFDDLAEHYRPFPKNPHADESRFTKYATAACECAKALAPCQSPTFRAIVVSPPPPSEVVTKRLAKRAFRAMAVATPPAMGMADISARVTTVMPPEACLLCREAVDVEIAREEDLRRQQPAEYERRKREAYVRGEGNPNPAVVTFTTEVACMAVNELLNRHDGRPVRIT
jgi:hypothetical protein